MVDGIERLVMSDFRYDKALAEVEDDVLLLEWDVAASPEDLHTFTEQALADPRRIMVAPYRLYVTSRRSQPLPSGPVWAHRYDTGHHVGEGDPFCHWFGLGMVYLPRWVVVEFLQDLAMYQRRNQWHEGFTDCLFSMWHWRAYRVEVPICWDVRPVHLHNQLISP